MNNLTQEMRLFSCDPIKSVGLGFTAVIAKRWDGPRSGSQHKEEGATVFQRI